MIKIDYADIEKGWIYYKGDIPYIKGGLKILLNKYRNTHACEICGKRHTKVDPLTFHHTIPEIKTNCITDMRYYGTPLKQFMKEVNTCELLCRHCHDIVDGNCKNLDISNI